MPGHADILDRPEPLAKPFAGSLVVHGSVIAALLLAAIFHSQTNDFGDPHPGAGTVGITTVKTLPVPTRSGPINRLASDTESVVPEAPPEPKRLQKMEIPDPKAIQLPSRDALRKPVPDTTSPSKYRPPHDYRKNQLYSASAPAMVTPDMGMPGDNGIGVGPNSTLGNRFGSYLAQVRDRVASKWNTGDVHSRGAIPRATVTFTILRDGTVQNPRLTQTSGNYALDISARRAVLDANPLPPLPGAFEKDSAVIEFWFQLKQ